MSSSCHVTCRCLSLGSYGYTVGIFYLPFLLIFLFGILLKLIIFFTQSLKSYRFTPRVFISTSIISGDQSQSSHLSSVNDRRKKKANIFTNLIDDLFSYSQISSMTRRHPHISTIELKKDCHPVAQRNISLKSFETQAPPIVVLARRSEI